MDMFYLQDWFEPHECGSEWVIVVEKTGKNIYAAVNGNETTVLC